MTEWIRFIGPGFIMRVPSEWMALSSTQFQVMFLSPPIADGRSFNLVLVMQSAQQNPQDYIQETIKQQAQAQENFVLVADGQFTTKTGVIGAHFAFTAVYQQNIPVFQRHVVFKRENTLYWFMASLPKDISDDLHQKIDDVFYMMLESFDFIDMNLEDLL